MAGTGEATLTPAFRLGHLRWLDGLRGVAILAVLGSHFDVLPGGFLGVDLFLVLSGFLITTLLIQEWQRFGAIDFKRFYLRRALRLTPALIAVLAVCGVVSLPMEAGTGAALRREIAVAACYITNLQTLHRTTMPTLGHTWSLALEEQFYIVWPLLLGLLLWRGLSCRRILLVMGAGIAASAAWRAALYDRHLTQHAAYYANFMRAYTSLDTRADALLVGCLIGMLVAWDLVPKSRAFLRSVSVAAVLCAAGLAYFFVTCHLSQPQLYCGLLTIVALMMGVVLVRLWLARAGPDRWVLESGPLVSLGRISYSLYLVHVPIMQWLAPNHLSWRTPAKALLAAGCCLAAALFLHFGIELPFLRLKQRLQSPSPAQSAASGAGRGITVSGGALQLGNGKQAETVI